MTSILENSLLSAQSDEEYYFEWWVVELLKAGFIKSIERFSIDFNTRATFDFFIEKQLKTKVKKEAKQLTIIGDSKYTGDCKICWSDKAKGIFMITPDSVISEKAYRYNKQLIFANAFNESFIDVKPEFQNPKHSYRWGEKQRYIWINSGIYVQKIVPQKLFKDTFTPQRYFFTNKSGELRTIKWQAQNLESFLNGF